MILETKIERKQVMGMSASQARFLGLTARKTNTEYEGQQVNQQRTVLSNESANYYNQLLGMTVPVPPAVADFTKTVYTFNDGALSNTISSMIAQKDGKYIVSYTTSWVNDFSAISTAPILYTREETKPATETDPAEYLYLVGSKVLRTMSGTVDTGTYVAKYKESGVEKEQGGLYEKDGKYYTDDTYLHVWLLPSGSSDVTYTKETRKTNIDDLKKFREEYNDEYLKSLSDKQLENLLIEEEQQIDILNKKYGKQKSDGTYSSQWMVRYVLNSSTGNWSPYFVDKTLLESPNMIYSDNGQAQSATRTYTIGSAPETEEIKGVTARMEQDSTGRVINITLHPGEDDEVTYAVATTTTTDQAKFEDAMNQYEYDKAQYDQAVQEINAKIEIIQAEDRNLELRLKQLDTEQDAIQTEMDAVQKVIEKNTESTFKTFG